MSIRSVCVDQARLLVHEPTTTRIEGRTNFVEVTGPWFRCRMFPVAAPDQTDTQQAHWKAVPRPQIIALTRALDGSVLAFHSDYRLEVDSKQLGRARWRITSEPQPIRKKRRVIGWLVDVERVIERKSEDLLDQQIPDLSELS